MVFFFQIFFGLICACAAFPQTYTPEVQAERQRFFQMFNAHAAAAAAAPDTNVHYGPTQHQYSKPAAPVHRFAVPHHQPTTQYHNNPQYNHAPQYHQTPAQAKWTGPLAATVPAGLPGSVAQVQNTPEVDAAIADFSRAYSAAVVATRANAPHANTYQAQPKYNSGAYNPQPTYNNHHGHYQPAPASQPRWTGPVAATIPAGLPGSTHQVADTPEVQQARAQFSRTYQQQLMGVLG